MPTTGSSASVLRRGWRCAWLVVLALAVSPALTPLTQRLGFSVTQRVNQNKRSEHPPKKVSTTIAHAAVLSSGQRDLATVPRHVVLPQVDELVHARAMRGAPDSLRAPPSTLPL